MRITGVVLCDTRMRTQFPTWQNALIAQRHPLSRGFAITVREVISGPAHAFGIDMRKTHQTILCEETSGPTFNRYEHGDCRLTGPRAKPEAGLVAGTCT